MNAHRCHRRRFPRYLGYLLAMVSLVFFITSCKSSPNPTPTVASTPAPTAGSLTTIRFGSPPIPNLVAAYVADDQGYFAQEGIKVDWVNLRSSSVGIPAAERGDIDMGDADIVTVYLARDSGSDVSVFGGLEWNGDPENTWALCVRSDSSIKTAKDLVGKKIGIVTLQNIIRYSSDNWLTSEGVDPKSVNYEVIAMGKIAGAVENGQVDAGMCSRGDVNTGKVKPIVWLWDPIPKNALTSVLWAKKSWLDQHRTVVQKFMIAYKKGWDYMQAHPQEAKAALAKRLGITDPQAISALEWGDLRNSPVTPDNLSYWSDNLAKAKWTKTRIAPEDVTWNP